MQYRLIHIHNDLKFLGDIQKYDDPRLYNEVIFIGMPVEDVRNILSKYNVKYYLFEETKENISKIIQLSVAYDAVVINSLCVYKKKIIEGLPSEGIKILLRLFGFELYHKLQDKYISKKTKLALYSIDDREKSMYYRVRALAKLFLSFVPLYRPALEKKVYEKISAVLLFNTFEYDELSQYFTLPKMIQLPIQHSHWNKLDPIDMQKEKLIIIGNSKSYWNNHIDTLEAIRTTDYMAGYKFFLFFSYGAESSYVERIREMAKSSDNIHLQESFLKLEEFSQVYQKASAVVINSLRQHALANIFTGLFNGCKIYLNHKSSTYRWLKDNEFVISDVFTLKEDLEHENISLTADDIQQNMRSYTKLLNQYTKKDFADNVVKEISRRS